MGEKKSILVLNGQYLPGYKGGGPIQSCVNMIEDLSDKFDFYVLTSDRDFKSDEAYKTVKINEWNQVGSAKVFYMSPDKQTIKGFNEMLGKIDFDIMYLNGFFSPIFTIKPLILRLLGKFKNKRIILTPRGDFTGGCENKKIKKYSYIYLSKIIGLYKGLIWHATSEIEEQDIRKKFKRADIISVPNLSAKYIEKDSMIEKKEGELRLVFISRIFPKKNLKFAIEVLKDIKQGNIIFDIYGPMEDKIYWDECEDIIKDVPENIKIQYRGEIEHCMISDIFSQYHAFLFPTLGENYGHVIVESMMNNCLCILSKGVTPWDEYISLINLGASLEDIDSFKADISRLVDMGQVEYEELVKKNCNYVRGILRNSSNINKYKNMFLESY